MQSSLDLYDLIKSLNKQEKRYFRLESIRQNAGDNQYVRLFDALESMNTFSEQALRKKLKGEKFLSRLSAVKNYLYNSLLSSLAAYHSGRTIARVLDEYMRNIHVLYRKALYPQCRKQILKAKALAAQHEQFTRWLDLLELEKNIHALRRFSETSSDELNAIHEEEKLILARIANTRNYYNKNARLALMLNQKGLRLLAEDRAEMDALMDEDFRDEERALTYDARLYFFNANAAYGQVTANREHSYKAARRYVEFLDSKQERLKENASRFVIGLSNFMISCQALQGKEKEIAGTILKLREIEHHKYFKEESIQLKIFLARYVNDAVLCIHSCAYDRADEIAQGIAQGLERFGEGININERMMLCYYLAYLFFGNGNYSAALKWNNHILHHYERNVREDIQCYSRLLNLIIHYEKGNVDILEYELKSTYRFLARRNRLFRFETVMLEFIRKNLSQPQTRKEILVQFVELRKQLAELFTNPEEKRSEEFFDFISWLDSKIQDRSFAEVKKEKLITETT